MASVEVTCERDGETTRLTCVECHAPICPRCLVRTPVGMKCHQCSAEPGAAVFRRRRRQTRLVALAVVAFVAATLIVLPRLLSGPETPENAGTDPLVGGPPNPQGPARFAGIGQEARDGDLAFTVTSIDCGATEVVGTVTRIAQGKFCLLALTMRNVGRGPIRFTGPAQMLEDAQSRRFGPDPAATSAHSANAGRDFLALTVNPGNEVAGVLVFDVATDVTPTVATLRAGPGPGPGAFVNLQPRP